MSKKSARKKLSSVTFDVADIVPLTDNQGKVFDSKDNLVLCGSAGSGKSFLACYLATVALSQKKQSSIVLVRSAVPTREIGYLPGTDKEKGRVYEEPYYSIFSEILQRGDAYDLIKQKDILYFRTTSYLRGLTLRDCTIIVDECQNMTLHELDSLVTRVGEGCRIIFCGDFKQSDLKDNGLKGFLKILERMDSFDIIEFTVDDIVRSGFVKDYIKAKESVESEKTQKGQRAIKAV